MGEAFRIWRDDLAGHATRSLLALHLAGMHENSPPGSVFALDLSGLQAPYVTVWSVWHGDAIAGIGALRTLQDGGGEVKSMRNHPHYLRQGVAALLLNHLVCEARKLGMRQLRLETGSGPAFDPALSLYRKFGFVSGPPFGDYVATDFNRFLRLPL